MRDEKDKDKGERIKEKTLKTFIEDRIFSYTSTDILFNQYRDEVKGIDKRGGAKLRRENLLNYISSLNEAPKVFLLGEAPGPWGARFSGVPFTGEGPLSRGELPFSGQQSSQSEVPYSERAGAVFWDALRNQHTKFFVWNTIPFHPHQPDEPLSLRTPKWSEVQEHLLLLDELISILEPSRFAAIGRVAEKALTTIGHDCVYVRHPSYGGVKLFREGMNLFFSKWR
jgi:uracil-DNA glycosylase